MNCLRIVCFLNYIKQASNNLPDFIDLLNEPFFFFIDSTNVNFSWDWEQIILNSESVGP